MCPSPHQGTARDGQREISFPPDRVLLFSDHAPILTLNPIRVEFTESGTWIRLLLAPPNLIRLANRPANRSTLVKGDRSCGD